MNAKRKVIGIFVCMLMLTTIPLAAGMTVDSEPDDPETTDVGRMTIGGFVLFFRHVGENYKFFALRVSYIEITGTTRTNGIWSMEPVTISDEYEIIWLSGPFGVFGSIHS